MRNRLKNGTKLLLATAERVSAKTLGILLGLCVGASASGLILLPGPPPPPVMEDEFAQAPFPSSNRGPSSASAPHFGANPARVPFVPYQPSGSPLNYDNAYSSLSDANPTEISESAESSSGFAIGGVGGRSALDSLEEAYQAAQQNLDRSASASSSASSAEGGGTTVFVGGTGGASSTGTETETTTSSYTKYLSLGTLASSVYSGDSLAATFSVEMRRSDTYSRETTWGDSLAVTAFTNSACTTAATGTLSVTAASLSMSLGTATLTNIIYTTPLATTEETIYLKITAATAGVSRCSSAVYVKQKFNAGTGYVLFQHGGTGASGRVAASKSDIPVDSALDSQNRIVVAGISLNAVGRHELAIWRYLPTGSLDTSFAGGNGFLTFQPGGNGAAGALNANKYDFPGGGRSLVIDSQDRIIVAGASRNAAGTYEITLWRFEEDGDLDTSFGGTGYIQFQPGGNGAAGAANGAKYDEGLAVIIDSSGRYLLAGNSKNNAGGSSPVMVRFLSDGTVDTTFANAGVAILGDGTAGFGGLTNATKSDWTVLAEPLSNGGYLIAGGSRTSVGSTVSILWKTDANGALDTTFGGGDGWMQVNEGAASFFGAAYASRDDGVTDVQISSSGQITALIYGNTAGSFYEVGLARFNSDGSPDSSFGTAGATSVLAGGRTLAGTDPNNKYDISSRLQIDSTGKLLVTASSFNDSWGTEPVLLRLTSAGALDTSFSADGIYTYSQNDTAGPGGEAAGTKRDAHNKPVVDGTTWHFLAQIPLLIDGGGRYVIPYATSVAAHPAAELAIIRVNTDGTLDQ